MPQKNTQGNLTKGAAHYVFRVDASHGIGKVYGMVLDRERRGGPGATITVDRGLLANVLGTSTSNAGGAWSLGGPLPVGTWEVTASKKRYTKTVMVTVTKDSSQMIDIEL
jgi:hypothetical protein